MSKSNYIAFFKVWGETLPRLKEVLKSNDEEKVVFLNKAGAWSWVLETADLKDDIALSTISIVMSKSTISEIFVRMLESKDEKYFIIAYKNAIKLIV